MFKLRISTLILRWYFMMVVAMIAIFTDQSWLIFGVMLVAVSAVLGYRIGGAPRKNTGRIVRLEGDYRKAQKWAG